VSDLPAHPPTPPLDRTSPLDRQILSRRLGTIMLVRVILFTLILGGTVAVNLAWGRPEELGGPYVTFLFVFIACVYVMNIAYALLQRTLRTDLSILAMIQIGVDLAVSAILVHFTGGADSAFVLFFLLSPITAAVTLGRRAAVITAIAGTAVLALFLILGFERWLPVLPGQAQLPWVVRPGAVGQSLLRNGAAMVAVAVLSGYLADQLRRAAERMEVQQAFIDDLAVLNADIIRCLTSGLITVGGNGVILTMNQSAAEILGLSSSPRTGQRLADVAPELAVVAEAEGQRREEVTLRRAGDRAQLLEVSISQLTDHRGQSRGRIINLQDLTSMRQMELRIKRAEHLASLGRLAAGIAHEIRNPLASISGSLQLLHATDQLDADDRRLMEIALREIERLNTLITGFLAYARPQTPSLEPVDLGEEIRVLAGGIAGLHSGEGLLAPPRVDAPAGLWVKADRDLLSSLLWNLLRNAAEAGEKEQVEIRVDPLDEEYVSLVVTDHGAGVAAEHLAHIFEPFYTTKDSGTGLGLATVHRIVQEHGGGIEVQSSVGRGTTFTITLPRCAPP
jgi:two-component system, NtrC family, sensor histidine kinase PilS